MDDVKDFAAVISLHNQLRAARRHVDMPVDDARTAYGCIDYRVPSLADGHATWTTSGCVELGNKA